MADNPYTSQSSVGYNLTPPPDDGSLSAANLVAWQTHLDKLGDPLHTFAQAIDAAILSAFGELVVTDDPATETSLIAQRFFS